MSAQFNDCIGALLHLGPNVITFRALLHLGPNVITFRNLLHLGQLLHLGLQQLPLKCIFSRNFANDWMYLPSLTAPQVDLSLTYENDVEFQMET